MQVTPRVVDLSHYQYDELGGRFDWDAIRRFGIWGVIYKATEGSSYVDYTYQDARRQVEDAGLLFGAYHFFRPGDATAQADHFLENAAPDGGTLLVLDHEDDGCSIGDVKEFMKRVEDKTGQRPALYSGNVIKEQLGSNRDEYLASCRLWLCQYGSSPSWPPNWDSMWLWQYTDGAAGPSPHEVPGIGNCDINSYGLSQADLERSWAPGAGPDVDVETGMTADEMLWTQASLNVVSNAGLEPDGLYGPATAGALKEFQRRHGIAPTGQPTKGTVQAILEELDAWNDDRRIINVDS